MNWTSSRQHPTHAWHQSKVTHLRKDDRLDLRVLLPHGVERLDQSIELRRRSELAPTEPRPRLVVVRVVHVAHLDVATGIVLVVGVSLGFPLPLRARRRLRFRRRRRRRRVAIRVLVRRVENGEDFGLGGRPGYGRAAGRGEERLRGLLRGRLWLGLSLRGALGDLGDLGLGERALLADGTADLHRSGGISRQYATRGKRETRRTSSSFASRSAKNPKMHSLHPAWSHGR